ncbi:MAG: M20/M25/M40 family metallo-hydrolase [Polyangiales bacterium]
MIDDAVRWLRGQQDEMVRSLAALVDASSHTRDKAGVDAAGARLERMVPLRCARVRSAEFGDHLVFGDRQAGAPGVILIGHHDTVFPREVFAGWREDGRLGRGPGALDMKGGLVVVAFALQALSRVGALRGLGVSLAVVSDEEVGSPESAPMLRALAQGADAALVFEAGREGDRVVTRRKGTGSVRVVAHGRAAHAGNAHRQGASAVRAMARFIEAAEALTDYDAGRTLNVGRVEGGIGKNTVPERCEADIDLRFERADDLRELHERLVAIAGESAMLGTRIEVSLGVGRPPMARTEASASLLAEFLACQSAAGLGGGECELQGGGSDASTVASVGVPAIDGLGPRGVGMHTLDERVELDSLVPKAEALLRFLGGRRDLRSSAESVLGSPP